MTNTMKNRKILLIVLYSILMDLLICIKAIAFSTSILLEGSPTPSSLSMLTHPPADLFHEAMIYPSLPPHGNDDRIQQIKAWYARAQELVKSEGSTAICRSKRWSVVEQEVSFPQHTRKCSYSEQYSILKSEIGGWEWGENITIYYKDGKIFFAIREVNTISGTFTFRVYYSESGTIIKILETSEDTIESINKTNIEVTDPTQKAQMAEFIRTHVSEVTTRLK